MLRLSMTLALGVTLLAGCATAEEEVGGALPPSDPQAQTTAARASVSCAPMANRMPLAGRASPYDSVTVPLGGAQAKVCYGRPSARGRAVFGGLIPFGKLWRTGANEPTIVHVPVAARIAGLAVEPGRYSLYTIPGEREWTVILNRSTSQWGAEGQYTPQIQAQENGRATVPAEQIQPPVETFTIGSAPTATGSELLLEWERTRVRIPITRG
ncbi:MAG: DUF2911 domain-containing protein [Gemmatimonadetes bacterium]|nr:DUF2911 domain-containing protein [Gemmatimonadota bacterium]